MTKIKSEGVEILNAVEASLKPDLQSLGFRSRQRTFTRTTSEGLKQLINFQMGAYDPPGTLEIPGFRKNLYGRVTVNLGVFVPEVAEYHGASRGGTRIHEYDCCLRARLGALGPEQRDVWWDLSDRVALVDDVRERLSRDAFPWFERFGTRDSILEQLSSKSAPAFTNVPRIVSAIILTKRGDTVAARTLLDQQIEEAGASPHAQYVRELSARLGLESSTSPF